MKSNTTPTTFNHSRTTFTRPLTASNFKPKNSTANAEDFEGYSEWSEDIEAIRLAEEETKAWERRKACHS